MSVLLRPVLLYNLGNGIHGHFRINRAVNRYRRRNSARAYATKRVKREQTVFGSFARRDFKNFGKFVDDLLRALNVTSRAETATDNVFPLGFKGEKRIERYDAVNFRNGYARTRGNDFLNFERIIYRLCLNVNALRRLSTIFDDLRRRQNFLNALSDEKRRE